MQQESRFYEFCLELFVIIDSLFIIVLLIACLRALHLTVNSDTIYLLSLKIVKKVSNEFLVLCVYGDEILALYQKDNSSTV
jgi:hypothetical protein